MNGRLCLGQRHLLEFSQRKETFDFPKSRSSQEEQEIIDRAAASREGVTGAQRSTPRKILRGDLTG